jgi:hypothetical protein
LTALGPGRPRSGVAARTTVAGVESPIDEAYGQEPGGRLHGCPGCNVTWFGPDASCWVCGVPADGPVLTVPPNGSQTWSPAHCLESDEDDETAAFARRMAAAGAAASPGMGDDPSGPGVVVFPVLGRQM